MDERLVKKIAEQLQENIFCPTGQGGGVDPSCGGKGGGGGSDVKNLVATALKNAKENRNSFKGWSHEKVAKDLIAYDADLEDADLEEVTSAVREHRMAGKANRN